MKKVILMALETVIRAAKEEKWNYVDKAIPNLLKKRDSVIWACEFGIYDPDRNLRDLGANIIEKAKLTEEELEKVSYRLLELVRNDYEDKYVKYRCAFALAKHGKAKEYTEVIEVLEDAIKDKAVSSIANKYLRELS
jgi:hypothetical protein